ncbi:unnamed protein product [Allacma fusca]|uniref:Uncharacterized protein n=1 Tax=Allacma fusca TaxID=39272 RepID=A0A8J2P9B5_9HEXA|nr:unnamed protein product [Allacma fusca]
MLRFRVRVRVRFRKQTFNEQYSPLEPTYTVLFLCLPEAHQLLLVQTDFLPENLHSWFAAFRSTTLPPVI